MSRIVTAEEARVLREAIERDGEPTRIQQQRIDLAFTVEQQAAQIAAVRALHWPVTSPNGRWVDCDLCSGHQEYSAPWPCDTARAVRVTA